VPYIVKVNMPNLQPGEKVLVHGLGELENGKTVRVSDHQADAFRALNATPVTEGGAVRLELGAPLDETNFPSGIEVVHESTTQEEQSAPEDNEEGS
jgi:hypothetical protein